MFIDVIWYGILLVIAGLVFYTTPEWVRSWYTKSAKNRRVTPLKRPEWQAKERRMALVMIGAGVAIIVLRLIIAGLVVDVIATIVLFILIAWRVLSFMSD